MGAAVAESRIAEDSETRGPGLIAFIPPPCLALSLAQTRKQAT